MKRRYDFEELGRRYGFDPRQVEKVCRISDFLEDLSNVLFLRDRLCLYGGTALSFYRRNNAQVGDKVEEVLEPLKLYRFRFEKAETVSSQRSLSPKGLRHLWLVH